MAAAADNEQQAPLRKRPRTLKALVGPPASPQPRLFAPFRALGLVTNHVPFALQTRSYKGATDGPRLNILTCLGRSWAMWDGAKMTLLFVGPDAPAPISSLFIEGDSTWASAGPHILKYIRGKEVDRLTNPLALNIASIIIFGERLLALTEDGSRLLIFYPSEGKLEGMLEFEAGFTATQMLHPATYINKILVSSSQGAMQLWNIRTRTCIHKFKSSRLRDSTDITSPCAITCLVQSPAIDVVGVGFSSGEISLYDIRADERLMRIFMDGGSISAVGFRSDGEPILASASSGGHIGLWDLNAGGRLLHLVRGAHDGAISALEWVPGQPVLISSGADNSVKQWLFESPTSAPRLLKFRSGHHEPPHLIRYYGGDGKQLLTTSRDRSLRCTSVVRDSRSFELSQGSIAKKASSLSIPLTSLKFPPITALSFSSLQSKDWDDVLTAHAEDTHARTWSIMGKRVGKHTLNIADVSGKKSKRKSGSVKAVCVTACGNFGIASSSTGAIYMWNMQSGIKRKSFDVGGPPVEVSARVRSSEKERSVTGIATDALNRIVIASTFDGTINFFDFHTTNLEHVVVLPAAATSITLQRDSGLLAVVCDDLTVRIVDIETRRIVREMGGFRGRVLDLAFSPDSRWLVTTSLDAVLRTFDVPTGRLIDAFRTASVATSVAFSPTNDFLATAHVDSVGVYLWANRAQYSNVSFRSIVEDDIAEVTLPSVQGAAEDEALEALAALTVRDPTDAFVNPDQLDGDLITLTLLPRSRWQTLLNLEVIQQRNKPKDPPKPPEKAPFFLPTLPGVEHRFAVAKRLDQDTAAVAKPTKRLEVGAAQAESTFYKKLASEDPEGDYEVLFAYVKTLSPAAIDVELRALVSLEGMELFLNALTRRLRTHRDFEAVQAFITVFLRIHGDVFTANAELRGSLEKLREAQVTESTRILDLVASSLGTLGFVRDVL